MARSSMAIHLELAFLVEAALAEMASEPLGEPKGEADGEPQATWTECCPDA